MVTRIGAGFLTASQVFVVFVAVIVGPLALRPAVLATLVIASLVAGLATFARLWPGRAAVEVSGERLVIRAQPYAVWTVSRAEVRGARVVRLPRVPRGVGTTAEGFLIGRAVMPDGRPAIVLAVGLRVLEVDLGDACAILAPEQFDDFVDDVRGRFVPVDG
jgi:hypothetical protein